MGSTNGRNGTDGTNTTITTITTGGADGGSGAGRDDPCHTGRETFRQVVDAEPAALSLLRSAFRRWLRRMRWPDDDAADLVMALNEAAANVIDHAYQYSTGDPPGDMRVLAERCDDRDGRRRVRLMVADSGRWRPIPTDPGHRGRGLRMMRACCSWLGVDPGPNGTCVTMISRACLGAVTLTAARAVPVPSAGAAVRSVPRARPASQREGAAVTARSSTDVRPARSGRRPPRSGL